MPPHQHKKFVRSKEPPGKLRLQPRDYEILKSLANFRFLSTKQILKLYCQSPGGKKTLQRRLQYMYHSKLVDRPPAQAYSVRPGESNHGNFLVYAIGYEGVRQLADQFSSNGSPVVRGRMDWLMRQDTDWPEELEKSGKKSIDQKNVEVKFPFIWHTLMVGDLRIAVTLALQDHPKAQLRDWEQGRGLLAKKDYVRIGGTKEPVIPDAFFYFYFPKAPQNRQQSHFFLEADRSTMPIDRFLRKIAVFEKWRKAGGHKKKYGIDHFRVLTTTISEKRRDNLRQAVGAKFFAPNGQRQGALRYLFACEKDYSIDEPKSVLQPIWLSPRGTAHQLLE